MLVRLTLVLFSSTTHSSVNHSSTCKQSLQAQQVLTLATVIRIKLLMPVLVMLVHTMTHPRKPLHLLTKLDTTLRLEWILLASTRTPGSLKLLPTHTQSNIGSNLFITCLSIILRARCTGLTRVVAPSITTWLLLLQITASTSQKTHRTRLLTATKVKSLRILGVDQAPQLPILTRVSGADGFILLNQPNLNGQ